MDGGSFREHALNRNRAEFHDVEFVPNLLRDVTTVDLRTKIAGTEAAMPVGIAPTGLTQLMHSKGETGGAQAAAAFGVSFALSTMGTGSIEPVPAPPAM